MSDVDIKQKALEAAAIKKKEEEAANLVSNLSAQDTTPWYRKRNLRYIYLLFFPTCIGVEMTSGFDSSLLNGLQAVGSWQSFFNHPQKELLGAMSAIYSAGAIVSLPFVPMITDGLGRRWAICIGSIIMIIGAVLQTLAQNTVMFIIARFILGLGIPMCIIASSSLLGELGHPKERAILGSLFNSCYFIGAIVAAGVTLGTYNIRTDWGWRIPSVLQVVPSIMQIAFVFLLPESPRWLISKGRHDEAFEVIVKYHAEGDRDSEFAKAEFLQIQTTLELEQETSKFGWKDLFKTPGMRRRLLIGSFIGLATQWSGNGLVSYFLAKILDNVGIKDYRTKNIINLGNTCWGFINATAIALTVTRFPRRTIYLMCTISLLLVFTGFTIAQARYFISPTQSASHAVLVFIFLYSPCYNLAYNALTYTFLVELFPFHSRAKGISVFQWFSRMAGFFNQFVNPIGIDKAGWKFYISYCVILLIEVLFVYFLFPETNGRTLEELAFLYEGDESREQNKRIQRDVAQDEKSSSVTPQKA